MAQHYGIAISDDANKNAVNVVLALWFGDDPASAENVSVPLNVSGDPGDPVTSWMGGRLYTDGELAILQDLANNMPVPSGGWPVTGVGGAVSEVEAIAGATALYRLVGTAETYTTQLAAQTREAALGALGLMVAEER